VPNRTETKTNHIYTNMKHIIAIIALAAIVLPASAQVPTYGSQSLWSTNGSTAIPSAVAKTVGAVIDCRKQNSVALQISAQGDTSVAAGFLAYSRSVDGSSYSSAKDSVSVTPTTAGVVVITNIPTYGVGFIKVDYYTNATGAAVTNLVLKYGVKISAH